MEIYVFSTICQRQTFWICLTCRIIRFVDGVCSGVLRTFKVACRNVGCIICISIVVPIRICCCGCCCIYASGYAVDSGIRLVQDSVISCGRTMAVDFCPFADFSNRWEFSACCITIQYSISVGIYIDILDRADLRTGKNRVAIHGCTGCSVGIWIFRSGIRCCCNAGIKASTIVIDTTALRSCTGNGRQVAGTAIYFGNVSCIRDNRTGAHKGIAFADQTDRRLVIIVSNDFGFASASIISGT